MPHGPAGPPLDHRGGVNVFDYLSKGRTVRARSRCIHTSTAECRPNAPLITSARPRFALQPSADHLLRALPLCLPVRSFHNLLRSWRGRRHRSRGMRLGTARRRSNAPWITPVRLCLAEKPSSYPHPVPTPRQLPSRYLSHTTFTPYHPLARARSRCMRISPSHSRPNAPLITS